METRKSPITIVGAGPGGATTALFLAKKGIDCTLVDKAVFPRDKICGDALSGKVVEILNRVDKDLIKNFAGKREQLPCWGVTFVAPDLTELSIPFKMDYESQQERATPPGFISPRLDFDNYLIEQVKSSKHIDFIEGASLDGYDREVPSGKFRLRFSAASGDFEISSDLLIVANGAQSRLAKTLGGIEKENNHYCGGIRAYYEGVEGIHTDNFIELHYLKEFLPGYFWIFPLPDGRANVGLGMRSDIIARNKINLKKKLPEIIEAYPSLRERFRNARPIDKVRGFGLPLGSKKRSISGQGYMLIGDAGSLIDPFTGEGIGNAMVSGNCAADQAERCLTEGRFDAAFMKEYDTAVYRRLWSELSLSRRMQQLVGKPWLFNFVVRKAANNKVLRETISCMFEDLDMRARLKQPSFYFKLLFAG